VQLKCKKTAQNPVSVCLYVIPMIKHKFLSPPIRKLEISVKGELAVNLMSRSSGRHRVVC